MVNNILTELQERNKQLLEENKALKKRFDVMKMNNLTEQEIREIVGSLNSNPDEGHKKRRMNQLKRISFQKKLIKNQSKKKKNWKKQKYLVLIPQ